MTEFKICSDGVIEPKEESLQKVILDLANRVRKPLNKEERELLKEIRWAEKMGYSLDLPFD